LLRQELGWGHDRGLHPATVGDHRDRCSDNCLAGSNVSLEQPGHGLVCAYIGKDLIDRTLLGTRELEWQD